MQDLNGKNAIITGGSQGLGYAMVEGLCEMGTTVCILDISNKTLESVEKLKNQGYKVFSVQVDLSNEKESQEAFKTAMELLKGKLDIFINNAGIHKSMPAFDLPLIEFQKIINVNVTTVFRMARLAAETMNQQGSGKIINIASVLSVQGGYNASAYSSSKGAVAQLTKSLSNEWAVNNIQVNAIAPGYFETELNQFILEDPNRYQSIVDRIPRGRFGNPKEVQGAVQFLSSSMSDYVTGIILPVDGGYLGR